jgi:hypothetical protein
VPTGPQRLPLRQFRAKTGPQNVRVGVIGTGVAGSLFLTAAQADSRHIDLTGFDQIRSNERDDAGTGLNIGPNALKALRLHGGIAVDALRAVSLPWRRWLIELTDGTTLIDLDLLTVAENPGIRIRWSDLYAVLRSGSASFTTYGRSLDALEEDSSGRLIPVFRNGDGELVREGTFDLLVAAMCRRLKCISLMEGISR